MLDGTSKIEDLVEAVARDGQPAVAITDHGNMYGAIPFYKECKSAGVNPIIGTEFYMARHSVDDRPQMKKRSKVTDDFGGETDTGEKMFHHITALAIDTTGYQNMMKLSSEAFLKGFYRKPRVDWDILAEHSEGIVVTSGCLGGVVLQELLKGNVEAAEHAASRLQDIFGKDNFFVELQDHGIPEQIRTNPQLMEIARKLGAPLVATNDSHYTHQCDHVAHDAFLCIGTGAKIADTDRFRFHGTEHYVKSAAEMRHLFREVPSACDNTLLIAERADIKIDFDQIRMPRFPVPDGFVSEEDYLRALVIEGAEAKYGILTSRVVDRLEYELDVICQMGFPGYFLITWDLIRHAKSAGILVGPGRGSAGGCAVAYCLGITAMDPLEHGLLFERFLNPARVSMPDIDIDIDSRYREHMINYCAKTYGEDRVAQIITFGTIKSRQAVRDAARVLDMPFSMGDTIAKALPPLLFGRDTPLRACLTHSDKHHDGFEQAGALRSLYAADPAARQVIDVAMGLENLRRSDGIHAAAVVISPDPLTDHVPIQKKPKGPITTQYEMHAIEDLGLLKEDFLGLTTLDVISDAAKLLFDRHGIELDLINWTLPLDDQPTYDLLRKGDTIGVFQLEGTQMRALLRDLEPTKFEHIAAVLALYRPGPLAANMHIDYAERKNGRAAIEVFHEDAKDMLKETYGLMIYQEQLMDVAQHFAGYSLGDAYLLLKTCAKKLPEAMAKEKDRFVNGVIERGFGEDFADMLFGTVSAFSDYAFNKCTTGDTVVIDGHSQERTIAELHRKLHNIKPPTSGRRPKGYNDDPCMECGKKKAATRGLCKGCYGWHQKFHADDKGFYLLALEPDGRIRPNRVKDIVHNGQRPVWKVTLDDGRSIKTTDNHRHLTVTGYVEVADLKVGDLLVTHEGVDTQSSFTNAMHRTTVGNRNNHGMPGVPGEGNNGYVDGGFARLQEWTKRTPKLCKVDPTHTGRIERAHLDGDRTNNDPSNLAMLCVSCHKKHDYGLGRTKRWGKGHLSGERRIVSIEPAGVQDVYDIEMATPEHNFVANGIVTHNSHSTGYGLISYWTAYMKANYPAEYMSALMTSVQSKHEKLSIFLSECKKMGLTVEGPSINVSNRNFQPIGDSTIVCGFLGIRNVGETPAQAIVEEREANGDFVDFFDYTSRVDAKALNKKVVEALVSSGVFDTLGVPRRGLVQVYPEFQEQMKRDAKRVEKLGNLTMFDIEPEVSKVGIPELHFDTAELLALEKEYLGVYISGHPLAEIQDILDEEVDISIHELKEMDPSLLGRCTIGGMVTNVDNKWTKKGDQMKIFRLEDQTGEIECVLFPRQTKMFGAYIEKDAVVYVNGNAEEDRNGVKILVEAVKLYQRALSTSKNVHLWLPDTYPLDEIKQRILDSKGDGPVTIRYMGRTVVLPDEYRSSVASLRQFLQV